MSHHSPVETIMANGCPIVLRRVDGPVARELFLGCRPPTGVAGARRQAQAIYGGLLDILEAEGGSFGSVVSETVFLRNLRANLDHVRSAREQVLAARGATVSGPATTEIEQPPVDEGVCLELSVQAVIGQRSPVRVERVAAKPACSCAECARAYGLRVQSGDEIRFRAGGLCGAGDSAYEQTRSMFTLAEELLQRAGLEFSDVVRAWIYLREMERDYGDLNRARREFFKARGIDPVPASTGIGGGPVSAVHDLCLGIYAVKGGHPPQRTVMTSPTLNEAGEYGADFVRGMRMVEANKVALHVSGTASIDKAGRTAHVGDFEAQADRMLVNVAALLKRQSASFRDIVSAVTYLKHPADAPRLREKFHQAGYEGFPNILVAAQVCRPELLCETEALAVLPGGAPTPVAK